MLAIIGLFTAGDSIWLRDLADSSGDPADLGERLNSAFTRLMVPRKERERISMLLNLWSRVRSIPPQNLKAGSFKRSALLHELISLVEITGFTREDAQRLHMLKSLLDSEHAVHEH
ncbi:MAG: hypothetical protein EBZ89_07220, partial [Chloroflexi bacterium]|nr:hypothetical protein [Chloroflexota bacterium]